MVAWLSRTLIERPRFLFIFFIDNQIRGEKGKKRERERQNNALSNERTLFYKIK